MKQLSMLPMIFLLSSLTPASAQSRKPVIVTIDVENYVQYRGDVADPTKLATNPNPTTSQGTTFLQNVQVADIVAINGKPARGLWQNRFVIMPFRPNPTPAQPIADLTSTGAVHCVWDILGPDGAYVGSLMDGGTLSSHGLMGGAGAFMNVTGLSVTSVSVPARVASMSEDPSMRRINGGGKARGVFYIYPTFVPAIEVTSNGPSIFHSDFSIVTSANPAHAGETLIVRATGLGSVSADLSPTGTVPFTASPLQNVISPVEITVNGTDVPAINKIGWPGETDVYRVDFQMPSSTTAGTATVQLTAAWIPGPTVTIAVK